MYTLYCFIAITIVLGSENYEYNNFVMSFVNLVCQEA